MIFRPQRGWQFLNKKQKRNEFWKYYSNVVIVKMDYNPVWIHGLKAGIRVRWQSTQRAKCWHSLLPYSHLIHKITKFKIFVLLVIIPTCLSFKLRSFLFDFVHQPSAAYPASRGYIFEVWAYGVRKVASADNHSIFYRACAKFVTRFASNWFVKSAWVSREWNLRKLPANNSPRAFVLFFCFASSGFKYFSRKISTDRLF